MINLQHLAQLVDFKKLGTLSAVAEKNNLTRPALTYNMKLLESELHVKLFERHSNYMTLTDVGEVVADRAESIIDSLESMKKDISKIDSFGKNIRVGTCVPVDENSLVAEMKKSFSLQKVFVEMNSIDMLLDGIRKDEYHFVILPFKPFDNELNSEFYRSDRLTFSLSKKDRYASSTELYFSDLNGETFLTHKGIHINDRIKNAMPDSEFVAPDDESFIQLLKQSSLPVVFSDFALNTQLKELVSDRVNIPISDDEAKIDYYIVFKKSLVEKYVKTND